MVETSKFQVGSKLLSVQRPHLKRWLHLEQIRSDADRIEGIYAYLSAFFSITVAEIDSWGWVDTLTLYQKAVEFTRPRLKLPYLENPEKKDKDEPFDYPQRLWYSFAHLLASNYHWQIEVIEELDIEDALAMIQEILIDLQLKREWEHSLSPLAYYSDTKDGASRFHPLPRPAWMIAEQKVRLVRMPKSALPVGNVQGLGEEFENAILAKGR